MAVIAKPAGGGTGDVGVNWTLTYTVLGITSTTVVVAGEIGAVRAACDTALAAIPNSVFVSVVRSPDATKNSAMAKLVKLGLTADEAASICGQ